MSDKKELKKCPHCQSIKFRYDPPIFVSWISAEVNVYCGDCGERIGTGTVKAVPVEVTPL